MTDTVVISLERFASRAKELAGFLDADFMLYSVDAFTSAFSSYRRIVAVMSAGIAVRSAAPLVNDKWTDPCVVVVSPNFRYAIPVLGGHHRGNDLAKELEDFGLFPVITTATETRGLPSVESTAEKMDLEIINKDSTRMVNSAILDGDAAVYVIPSPSIAVVPPGVSVLMRKGDFIVGVGCRRGASCDEIKKALCSALADSGISKEEVLVYATSTVKVDETGLIQAVDELDGTLVFVDDETLKEQVPPTPSRALDKLGLPGVAEPAALALSRRKEIVMEKRIYGGVTVAVIR